MHKSQEPQKLFSVSGHASQGTRYRGSGYLSRGSNTISLPMLGNQKDYALADNRIFLLKPGVLGWVEKKLCLKRSLRVPHGCPCLTKCPEVPHKELTIRDHSFLQAEAVVFETVTYTRASISSRW